MAITTRSGKGSPLTHGELDTNFTELDTRLVSIEAVDVINLDARVVVLENEDDALDLRLDAIEALNLDLRITSNENRLDAYDLHQLDGRIETIENQTLDARLTVVEDFDTTVTTSLNGKLSLTGGTMTGNLGLVSVIETVSLLGNVTGNLSIDATTSTAHTLTSTGPIVFDGFTSAVAGQSATLFVTQNGSGTWSDSVSAKYGKNISSLSLQSGLVDVINVFYDGSTYYISISKGFE